jgi:protein phosphatase
VKLGSAAGVTDPGRRRLRNEDAFICEPPLFAVADGMGGARAGEVAAGLAAAALEEAGAETRGPDEIAALLVEANRRIWERSLQDPATAGMGTTVTAMLLDPHSDTVAVAHVGDSRAYRLRDGELEQLTTDHSLVAELVESGVLTPEEAERHPQRSAITRALGTEATVDVDAFTVDAEPGDVFLVCSDGLSSMVPDDEIAAIVADGSGDLGEASEALVRAANAHGGEDNITVVLFEVVEGEPGTPAPPSPAAPAAPSDRSERDGHEAAPESDVPHQPEASPGRLTRHGAGKGGRLPAILLVATVLAVAVLVLYWGATR